MAYDDDNQPQGLGTQPSGPDFVAPKTYNADPETAAAETGDQGSSSETDSTTAAEQAAVGGISNTPSSGGGFVKDAKSFLNEKSPSGINFAKKRQKQGMMIGAGIVLFFVITIFSVLFTFNIPSAQVRAAGNGLFTTYLGSQVMQNNIHFGNYWNGAITDYLRQVCVGSDCTLKGTPKSYLEKKSSFLDAARSKTARFAVQKMQVKGVELLGENGKFIGLRVNTEKTGSPFVSETDAAKLKATIEGQIKPLLGNDVAVNVEKISGSRYGGTFKVTTRSLTGVNNQRLLYGMALKTGATNTSYAKIGFIRNTMKVLGLGFQPLKMLRDAYTSKINGAADTYIKGLLGEDSGTPRSGTIQGVEDGKNTTSDPKSSSYDSMKKIANDFLESKGGKATGGALAVAGVACIAASIVDGTNTLVLQNNQYPAARLSTTYMAAGETVSSVTKPNVDWQGVDAFSNMLETRNADGTVNSFSQSAVWRHANSMGGGKELDNTRATALGMGKADPTVQQDLGAVVSAIGTGVCSGAIGSMITAAGVVVMVISGPAAIIEGAILAGALAVALPTITKIIAGSEVDLTTYKNDPASLYNLAGSGTKFLRDVTGWSHGSTSQSSADQAKYATLAYDQRESAFKSKSLAARIFDVQDPMSSAGKLAANSSRYPSQNLASLSSTFVSIFSNSVGTIGSLLSKNTLAATTERYDICTQDKWGCTGLSAAVMNDDGSTAISYLSNPNLTPSDPKLDWMMRCHDDEFYQDSSINNVWTFRVVENTPAYFKYETGHLDADCTDPNMVNNPVIVSLMSYTNLEPQAALQACSEADGTSTDALDIAACAKQGYDGSSTDSASASSSAQTITKVMKAWSEGESSAVLSQTHGEATADTKSTQGLYIAGGFTRSSPTQTFAVLHQRRYIL